MLSTFDSSSAKHSAQRNERREKEMAFQRQQGSSSSGNSDGSNNSLSSSSSRTALETSLEYARKLVYASDDFAPCGGQEANNRIIMDAKNLPLPYDPKEMEPSTYKTGHGAYFLRFYVCWTDNVSLSRRTYYAIAVLIALVAVIALGVGLSQQRHSPSPLKDQATLVPTMAPHLNFAHGLVSSLLVNFKILRVEHLEDSNSPQRLAINYIIQTSLRDEVHFAHNPATDLHQQDWKTHGTLRRVVELYSVAVFYYSTGGSEWTKGTNWMEFNASTPCDWLGVQCDSVEVLIQGNHSLGNNNTAMALAQQDSPQTKTLTVVTDLTLNSNNLDGTIPIEIQYFDSLKTLNLEGNSLRADLPQVLPKDLMQLRLGDNRLRDNFPVAWALQGSLEYLDLHENEIRGPLPNDWKAASLLKTLYLHHNFLNGQLPDFLPPKLESINLDNNRMTGNLKSSWEHAASLKNISLRDNRLSDTATTILRFQGLEYLNLAENDFTGAINFVGALGRLKELRIFKNDFTGTIPASLPSSLSVLSASRNQLTGSLPSDLPLSLVTLKLDFNRLTYSLPTSMTRLTSLEQLGLSNNQITGRIPSTFFFPKLTSVQLNDNLLTGTLAGPLGSGSLQTVKLHSNEITGNVPSEYCQIEQLEELAVDCAELLECSCCTDCY